MTIAIGNQSDQTARSITATVRRRQSATVGGKATAILDSREHDICWRIVRRTAEVLLQQTSNSSDASIQAISNSFDEYVVANHIQEHHDFKITISSVLGSLHTLSEQSYENKALTFGCVIDPNKTGQPTGARFPLDFLQSKRYKALSDGFRTAYVVSTDGRVLSFVDLDKYSKEGLTEVPPIVWTGVPRQ